MNLIPIATILASSYKVKLNIILQGAGNVENELKISYNSYIQSIFIPSPRNLIDSRFIKAFYESNNSLVFVEDDYSLLLNDPSSQNVLIFHDYDKSKRLYPFGFYCLVNILFSLSKKFISVSMQNTFLCSHELPILPECLNYYHI